MKNYKSKLLNALFMLRTALTDQDKEIAENIIVDGGSDKEDLQKYIDQLDELIDKVLNKKTSD
jgi:hypothetical protein